MKIKQITDDELRRDDYIPVVVVERPVSYFTQQGFAFQEDCDDFDYHHYALFEREDGTQFMLIHYRGFPPDQTTLYAPAETADELEPLKAWVAEILPAL